MRLLWTMCTSSAALVFLVPTVHALRVPASTHLYELPRSERTNARQASAVNQQHVPSSALERFASFLVGAENAHVAWTAAGHHIPFRSTSAPLRHPLHPGMLTRHPEVHDRLVNRAHRHDLSIDRRKFAAAALIGASTLLAPGAGHAENFGNWKLGSEVPMATEVREKMYSETCMEATNVDIFPYGEREVVNDCLLLPQRAVMFRGKNFLVRQGDLFEKDVPEGADLKKYNGPDGTGASVWAGAIVLTKYIDQLGPEYFQGKTVVELGCGNGLASIAAVKQGATVVATDDDPQVLEFAQQNARLNLNDEELKRFQTLRFRWGTKPPKTLLNANLVMGSDIMYQPEVRPVLASAIKALSKPTILSVVARRLGELEEIRNFLQDEGFNPAMLKSPMKKGYGAEAANIAVIDEPSLMPLFPKQPKSR